MTVEWRKAILGFTPVCTMAKELAVALASNHLTKTENFQAHTCTATGESWSINKGQCYIRKVRAESVCPTFHCSSQDVLWQWHHLTRSRLARLEIEKLRMRIILPWTVTIQCNGMGGTICCWAYVVVRNDIRDPLATMKDLFVSFRFIEPSSDNLRLIIKFKNTIFIQNLN